VIECNARLGGASTLALAAGLMSLAWFARESDGLDPADISFTPRPAGWQLVRVPQDVIRDPGL
jgi:carbamoyl-phosphate synthase large subunit